MTPCSPDWRLHGMSLSTSTRFVALAAAAEERVWLACRRCPGRSGHDIAVPLSHSRPSKRPKRSNTCAAAELEAVAFQTAWPSNCVRDLIRRTTSDGLDCPGARTLRLQSTAKAAGTCKLPRQTCGTIWRRNFLACSFPATGWAAAMVRSPKAAASSIRAPPSGRPYLKPRPLSRQQGGHPGP